MPATDVEVEEAVSLVTADVVPSIPVVIVAVSTATALMESAMGLDGKTLFHLILPARMPNGTESCEAVNAPLRLSGSEAERKSAKG